MKLIVCGAAGMLGQDVVRAAELADHEVLALDRRALDVTDPDAIAPLFERERPDSVVNCAAYTDVDGAEREPDTALRVNAGGARNVAGAAARVGASVLYVSTDYVFDGTKGEAYVESDEPRPLGSYGASKLAGEVETAAVNPNHQVVRTSWLFGTAGRNFVETMIELGSSRREVTVVCDQVGSPTYTAHLAEAIVRLSAGESYGLHHTAAAGECSWYDFAVAIFNRAGLACDVLSTTTAELGRPAPRPEHSVLSTERGDGVHLPDWRTGLDDYITER
ncbi:MAG: dTDP-4-dehydrorhamnose reductase [Thermoleophilaceae bacterium]